MRGQGPRVGQINFLINNHYSLRSGDAANCDEEGQEQKMLSDISKGRQHLLFSNCLGKVN